MGPGKVGVDREPNNGVEKGPEERKWQRVGIREVLRLQSGRISYSV